MIGSKIDRKSRAKRAIRAIRALDYDIKTSTNYDRSPSKSRLMISFSNLQSRSAESQAWFLVTVTMIQSQGPIRTFIKEDATVKDLIRATLDAYSKQGRMPVLDSFDTETFQLRYCQFSMHYLNHEEYVKHLGSRNFVLSHGLKRSQPNVHLFNYNNQRCLWIMRAKKLWNIIFFCFLFRCI